MPTAAVLPPENPYKTSQELSKINSAATKSFLESGAQESTASLGNEYKRLQGIAGGGGFSSPGGASPLAARIQALQTQRQNDIEGGFQRELPLAFADRNAGFQGVADKNMQAQQIQNQIKDMLDAQRTAKRKNFQKGLGQTAAALAVTGATGGAGYGMMAGGGAGLLYK